MLENIGGEKRLDRILDGISQRFSPQHERVSDPGDQDPKQSAQDDQAPFADQGAGAHSDKRPINQKRDYSIPK
jgi:hypothetical protein